MAREVLDAGLAAKLDEYALRSFVEDSR